MDDHPPTSERAKQHVGGPEEGQSDTVTQRRRLRFFALLLFLVTRYPAALAGLLLIPLLQSGLLLGEYGVQFLLNSPDIDSISDFGLRFNFLNINMPGAALFSVALFFVVLATLISLFALTSDHFVRSFSSQEYKHILVLNIFLVGVLLAIEIISLGASLTASPSQRLFAQLLGFGAGFTTGAALSLLLFYVVHLWTIDLAHESSKILGWRIAALTLACTIVNGARSNAIAIVTMIGLGIALYMGWKRVEHGVRLALITVAVSASIVVALFASHGAVLAPTSGLSISPTVAERMKAWRCADNRPLGSGPEAAGAGLHSPSVALKAWGRTLGQRKPTIIAVVASGGGYRATYWTATVLDSIRARAPTDRRLADFFPNVRVLAAASGGAVALGYLAASPAATERITDLLRRDVQRDKSPRQGAEHGTDQVLSAIDSLLPVLNSLLWHDLLGSVGLDQPLNWMRRLLSLEPKDDRGVALEQQWRTLDRPFSSLNFNESEGSRPALLVAPTVGETGEPLIISNVLLGRGLARDCPLQLAELLPEAFRRVSLARAVRAAATFPYISPLMPLTEGNEFHLADAGFTDNLGIDLVVLYFSQADVQRWILENDAKVMVVQIRAFPGSTVHQPDRAVAIERGSCGKGTGYWPTFLRRIQFYLASTILTMQNAKSAGNVSRGEHQLELLRRSFPQDRFQTVVFENYTDVSMSWHITGDEQACIASEMDQNENRAALDTLAKFLE